MSNLSGAYSENNQTRLSGEEHEELKWVLYLTLVFCFLEVIMIYGKYDFLNVILEIT